MPSVEQVSADALVRQIHGELLHEEVKRGIPEAAWNGDDGAENVAWAAAYDALLQILRAWTPEQQADWERRRDEARPRYQAIYDREKERRDE